MQAGWVMLLGVPLLAPAASPIAGDQVCVECHRAQSAFSTTPMAQALESASQCDILQRHPDLSFQEGPYKSQIKRASNGTTLTVTDGRDTLTATLLWAFGRGQAGQTYVFERNGAFYESRVSFYNALGGLDLTMGAHGSKAADLETAAGRRMDAIDARNCFACHSTGGITAGRLHLESMAPGVGCESCHGPAVKHIAAVRAGDAAGAALPKLAALTAEETSELCGRCHRTWSQIALNGPRGVNNVRFQPYRLANSKCYDTTDARIRCTACHDPHGPLETNLARYDSKCTACHSAAAHTSAAANTKVCKVAKADCVTCHMPKLPLPGAHASFTDHQIRVARPNDPYPN